MVKKQDYDPALYEPLYPKYDAVTIKYFLDLGKKLKIDANYHVYFGNKWIANARPARKRNHDKP